MTRVKSHGVPRTAGFATTRQKLIYRHPALQKSIALLVRSQCARGLKLDRLSRSLRGVLTIMERIPP